MKALVLVSIGCTNDAVELGEAVYKEELFRTRCAPGARAGLAGITNGESTKQGIRYNVRAPVNYNPTIGHPLLVVYAPASRSRAGTERFTDLTREATGEGFIVVYPEHRRLSMSAIVELGAIPGSVAKKWCVDEKRVYLTGHSDGGTVAMGLAFLPETKHIPTAVAPSAVGTKGSDLAEYTCPDPIPVMVMHSAEDSLFPGYGAEAAAWWAACNRCDSAPGAAMDNGCTAYLNCADDVATWYCKGTGSHPAWPQLNSSMIGFFNASGDF